MPPEFDPGRLVEVLARHGVEYVLIGGFATVQHGSPFLTQDLDITPAKSEVNLARLSSALDDMHALVRTSSDPDGLPFDHDGSSLGDALVWNLVTDFGDLDISFVPDGTAGFDDLRRDADVIEIHGIAVRVGSLADVIRSKQAANRPKDQRVLPTLREILAARHAPRE